MASIHGLIHSHAVIEHSHLELWRGYMLDLPSLVMEYVKMSSFSYLIHYCEDSKVEAKRMYGRIKREVILGIVFGFTAF